MCRAAAAAGRGGAGATAGIEPGTGISRAGNKRSGEMKCSKE